jgi:transcriptional regulator with XRE-family HTH domain
LTDRSSGPLPGFGRLLTGAMERRGLTTDELAGGSELDGDRVALFLDGEAEPSATELLRLAGALGVTPQSLLKGIHWSPSADDPAGRFWFEEPSGD